MQKMKDAKKENPCVIAFKAILIGLKTLVQNPCTRWLLLGNLVLSISAFLFSYSLPKYFNFYNKEKMYAELNAMCVVFGGCTSCLLSGIIANRLDKNSSNLRAKSYISGSMCLIAVPICSLLFLVQSSFVFSIIMLFLYDLLCLGYYAPVMSMIQATVEPEKKGAAIGAFGFVNNYTQALTSLLIGYLVTSYELDKDMPTFGTLMAALTAIPSLIAGLCFLRAGPEYEKIIKRQKEESEKAIVKAEESEIQLVDTNIE